MEREKAQSHSSGIPCQDTLRVESTNRSLRQEWSGTCLCQVPSRYFREMPRCVTDELSTLFRYCEQWSNRTRVCGIPVRGGSVFGASSAGEILCVILQGVCTEMKVAARCAASCNELISTSCRDVQLSEHSLTDAGCACRQGPCGRCGTDDGWVLNRVAGTFRSAVRVRGSDFDSANAATSRLSAAWDP